MHVPLLIFECVFCPFGEKMNANSIYDEKNCDYKSLDDFTYNAY